MLKIASQNGIAARRRVICMNFSFGVYPYLCLTILGLGLLFRYLTTPGNGMRDRVIFCKKIACHRFIYLSLCNNTDILGHFSAFDSGLGHGRIGSFLQGASGSGRNIPAKILAPCVFAGLLFFFRGAWL